MENLISDCLPPIFSYLPLSDLLHLRTVSRRLKQEVEDYLPNVRSLPLYLTTSRTPEEIARYENMCVLYQNTWVCNSDLLSEDPCFRRLPFGTSGEGAFEDLTILQNQNHFRRSDFLILNHSSALFKFLKFIKKHCSNIEKLAIVIDHCDHYLREVSKVFEAFSAIKVLLLERTMQDSYRHNDPTIDRAEVGYPEVEFIRFLRDRPINRFELPPEVYNSILALNRLEELFFFSKRHCQLSINREAERPEHYFLKNLLGRLRVFHVNSFHRFYIDCGIEEKLEEHACQSDLWLKVNKNGFIFPRLKKLIVLQNYWSCTIKFSPFPRPSLKVLDISNDHHSICPISTQNLNYFTGLESFHCGDIWVSTKFECPPRKMRKTEEESEEYDLEIVPDELKNWTIKHLQVMKGPEDGNRSRDARRWSKYFVALETCTFLEPEYSVIRISDLPK